jgi:hypothetical protein
MMETVVMETQGVMFVNAKQLCFHAAAAAAAAEQQQLYIHPGECNEITMCKHTCTHTRKHTYTLCRSLSLSRHVIIINNMQREKDNVINPNLKPDSTHICRHTPTHI